MKLDKLYKIKVESYRDFRSHLLECFKAYTIGLGALAYFAFNSWPEKLLLFRVMWVTLLGFLVLAVFLSRYYISHADITAKHVEKLCKDLRIEDEFAQGKVDVADYAEDGKGMRAAMWTFAFLNACALIFSILIAVWFWHGK